MKQFDRLDELIDENDRLQAELAKSQQRLAAAGESVTDARNYIAQLIVQDMAKGTASPPLQAEPAQPPDEVWGKPSSVRQSDIDTPPAVTIEDIDPVKLHQRLMVLEAAVQPIVELWEAWGKYASSSDSGDYNLTEWLHYKNNLNKIAKMFFELAAAALKAGE